MSISLEKPTKLSHWLRIYRLYRSAFPAYERKPFALILKMYRAGKSHIWYCSQNGDFAGLAISLNGGELVLLDYFAVDDKSRGCGVGSALLRALMDKYEHMFLEIESIYESADNLDERVRRREFYLRNGLCPMNTMVNLFGTKMELLGANCQLDFPQYFEFYESIMGSWTASHIKEA